MAEITMGVNWLAVIVGTVASFLLGWFWYSPKLFGTKWAAGVGIDISPENAKFPAAAMGTQLLAVFLLAWIVGVTATNNALLTAILVIASVALFVASSGFFTKNSNLAIDVAAGYIVAIGIMMIIFQGIF